MGLLACSDPNDEDAQPPCYDKSMFWLATTGGGATAHWPTEACIPLDLNPTAGAGVTSDELQAALQGAVGVWNASGCACFEIRSVDPTLVAGFAADGPNTNAVVMVTDPANWMESYPTDAAGAVLSFDRLSGEIQDVDIVLKGFSGTVWSTNGQAGTWDLEAALTRQLGTALGIVAVAGGDSVMTGAAPPAGSSYALSENDRKAACAATSEDPVACACGSLETICDGNDRLACAADRQGFEYLATCPAGSTCSDGACVAP